MPGISVIVTVYNKEQYLTECMDSILAQTYRDIEVLVVDDGSTDGSAGLAGEYAARDARVRVIRKANGGQRSATVAGVRAAAAPLCGFVDADDKISPDMYERLYAALEAHNADGACCGMVSFGGGRPDYAQRPIGGVYSRAAIRERFLAPFYEQTAALGNGWSASRCDKLYRTPLMAKVCGELDGSMSHREDYEVNLRYLPLCSAVVTVPEPLYHYRRAADSFTRSFSPKYIGGCRYSAAVLQGLAREQGWHGRAVKGLYKKDLRLGYFVLWEGRIPLGEKIVNAALLVRALLGREGQTPCTAGPPETPRPAAGALLRAAGAASYGGYWLFKALQRCAVAVYHAAVRR